MTPSDRFPIKPEVVQMLDNWKDTKKLSGSLKDIHLKCEEEKINILINLI